MDKTGKSTKRLAAAKELSSVIATYYQECNEAGANGQAHAHSLPPGRWAVSQSSSQSPLSAAFVS